MAGYQDLHIHTSFSDGKRSPEEMIEEAIKKGCDSIGISDHSYVTFDEDFSMDPETTHEYIRAVNLLKDEYKGKIEVFLGIEQDYHTAWLPEGLDYKIGAAHYVKVGEEYISVDSGAKFQQSMVDEHFSGDHYTMVEAYFSTIADIMNVSNVDFIGHFDLIAKYNFDGSLFDETHPRYVGAALGAMDEILKRCNLFEVNTGMMFRHDKPEPYPSVFLLKELQKRGGEVLLTSDSHVAESLCHKFPEMKELLKACGFMHIKRLTKNGFVDERV
jgi:histidinol-phosphatase (PHP family)